MDSMRHNCAVLWLWLKVDKKPAKACIVQRHLTTAKLQNMTQKWDHSNNS